MRYTSQIGLFKNGFFHQESSALKIQVMDSHLLLYSPDGHAAYQDTCISNFLKSYPDPFILPKGTWDYIVQFWYFDLSLTDSIIWDCYSVFGPQP